MMTTIELDTMIDEWRDARADAVDDISLYLCGQDDDAKSEFLRFWNDKIEVEFLTLAPSERGVFIWRLIESVLARVRAIELGGVSARLN